MFSGKNFVVFLSALFTEHLRATASYKTVFIIRFIHWKVFFVMIKLSPEEHDKKIEDASWIFDHQAYFIKASVVYSRM